MFDLESEIKNWRTELHRHKVGDGEILDELENHLREETDRNVKTGIPEADAFMNAVAKIGAVAELKREFRKAGGKRTVIKASLLILGWAAAAVMLSGSAYALEWHWNFWNWKPKFDLESTGELLGIAISAAGFWFLAKHSRDLASRSGSLLICVACLSSAILLAIYRLTPEATGPSPFGRTRHSPVWYRGGMILLWCIPIVLWLWSRMRKKGASVKQHSLSVER